MTLRFFVLAAFVTVAASCATIPTDPEAFRADAKKDAHVETATLANISIDTATKRLYTYASQCLNMKTVSVYTGPNIVIGSNQTDVSRFTPKFAGNMNQATLTLQFNFAHSVSAQEIPADGVYLATIDLEKDEKGSTFTAYYVDRAAYRFKNVATRGLEWVTDEKHLCPDLRVGI